jgi:hypothetical protein
MTYVAHITVPVVFQANNDAHARFLLQSLRECFADVPVRDWLPAVSSVEVSDYPDATLQDVQPYEEPRAVDVDNSGKDARPELTPANATTCDDCGTPVHVVTSADGYPDVVTPDGVVHTCPEQQPARIRAIVDSWPRS